MEGHDYEYLAAQYLRNHGYKFVEVTKASGDYGIDVIAHKGTHKYAVQCKYYSHPVGVEAIQEAVAGKAMYDCDRAMVITNSTYTKAAKNLADKNNVLLLSEIESATKVSKLSNRIGNILILISIFFICAFMSFMFDGLKGQPSVHIISIVLLLSILLALTIILYIYINKFLKLNGKPSKIILAFCSFMFVLWEMSEFMSIPKLIEVSNYTELFKTLGINCGALGAVVILLYFFKKTKKDKNENYTETATDLDKFVENMEHISSVLAEVEDENQRMNSLLCEDDKTEIYTNISKEISNTNINNYSNEELLMAISNWLESKKAFFDEVQYCVLPTSQEDEKEKNERETKIKIELNRVAELLVPTFKMYGVEVGLVDKSISSEIIIFSIKPLNGTKINSIKKSLFDVSLSLGVYPFELTVASEEGLIHLYSKTNFAPQTEIVETISNLLSDTNTKCLVQQAVFVVMKSDNPSTTLIQRKLSIGYAQAAMILDKLEMCGLIERDINSRKNKLLISESEMIRQHISEQKA